jgi:hypothetical protein
MTYPWGWSAGGAATLSIQQTRNPPVDILLRVHAEEDVNMLSALQLSSMEKAAATTRLIKPVALMSDYPDLAGVPNVSP